MKVAELIEKLKAMPPDAMVILNHRECEFVEAEYVSLRSEAAGSLLDDKDLQQVRAVHIT